MDKERYAKIKKISGDIWALYVKKLSELDTLPGMTESERDKWWDNTLHIFSSYATEKKEKYEEKFATSMCICFLEEIQDVYKQMQNQ